MTDLFGDVIPEAEPAQPAQDPWSRLSPDQRRTERQRVSLARGIHPVNGLPLLSNSDARCGSCAHFLRHDSYSKTYFKCTISEMSLGPATDIRKSWPACVRFEIPKFESEGE